MIFPRTEAVQTLVIAIPAVNRAVIDADAVASWNWTLSTPLDGQLTSSPPPLLLLKVVSSTRRLLSRAESYCCLSAAQRLRLLKTAAAASKSPPPPSCCGDSCPAEQSRAQDRLHTWWWTCFTSPSTCLPSLPQAFPSLSCWPARVFLPLAPIAARVLVSDAR